MAMASSLTPREHVEKIRRETFFIGREEKNPLARFLHQAVTYLSEELYTKDSHFITELIQNAQDNEYEEGVVPTLEFVVTDRDLTRTGATTTLLVFNNERGFSPANVESICGVGQSIKKGNRHRGYVGEKGIGFKSVFLVCSQPHIFSRGYQIKLNEKPSPDCNIGYIVPEWVENNPCMHELEQVYDSSSKTMPTTTIILPLKSDKVKTVMDQLSDIHPEILLFLSKIRSLSVREDKTNSKVSAERSLSISSEINFQVQKNMDAESFTLHLTNQGRESGKEETCSYYMWRQKFPVKPENRVEKRKEVEEWTITLAFPHGPRLRAGMELPGIYAFLPTGMVTNFPFIIQADFILVSSRETILLDNAWNMGILESVAPAFRNALLELVKSNAEIPLSLIPDLFRFLPTKNSNFPELEKVRIRIKDLLVAEDIIPCETYMEQRIFCKGSEVGRLKPAFWDILDGARKANVNLCNISCHGTQILSPSFDDCRYDSILQFLGVGFVSVDWYGKFIKDTNIAAELPEAVYLDLLFFIASNWDGYFSRSNVTGAPLLKVVTDNGGVALWTVDQATRSSERICLLSDLSELPWLIKWNREFKYVSKLFFVPQATQVAMNTYSSQWTVKKWLSDCASVHTLSLQDYCTSLLKAARGSQKHLINFTHFLFHSISKKDNLNWQVKKMCESLPLVDNYGSIIDKYKGVLLPAQYSKWVGLVGSNPWRSENYVELSQDYGREASFAGCNITPRGGLLNFLRSHVGASDVPDIRPPNAKFPTASSLLSKKNAFLLLDWIRNLKRRGVTIPDKFMHCVKSGPWLETSLGAKAPEVSFLSNSEWGNLLQMGSLLIDLPLVKHEYYDHRINDYKDELKMLGVMSEFREACQFIGKHFISKVGLSSNLSSRSVVFMLKFIRFLTQRYLPTNDFVDSIKEARWLKTCHGYKSPGEAILHDSDWYSASCISDLPFIDRNYYAENFHAYKSELALLGVTVGFDHRLHSQLVIDNTRDLISSKSLSSNDVAFMLECIRNARNTHHLVDKLRAQKWVVTKLGPKCPEESTLFDPEWECVFKVVDNLPLIDEKFYGVGIRGYKAELRTLGVLVDLEDVLNAVIGKLKLLGSSNCSLNKAKACALLACYRRLLEKKVVLKPEFNDFICKAAWLQTNLGCRSPANSILFNEEWAPISAVASLPFIDYGGKCHGEEIQKYKAELKALGVAAEFEEGVGFVMKGINLPSNPSEITSRSALSLFECIRIMRRKKLDLTDEFLRGIISKKWLKTSLGYKSPRGCALFGPEWAPFLELGDAAFIDESFYGSEITDYRDELDTIGVIVYPFLGNEIVVDRLKKHDTDMKTVIRIYSFLRKNKWKARKQEHHSLIYVPNNNSNGEWVTPESCILHDKDNLFGMKLHVLERYYDKELLRFFGESFGVMSSPSITHYHDLWNDWEATKQHLTESECSSVWMCFVRDFSIKSSPSLLLSLRKLPVMTTTGGIMLAERDDVFIPDDLLLKDLFDKASDTTSLFVWHPMTCSPFMSTSKLFGVYSQLGVQNISTAVSKSEISVPTSRKVLGGDKLFGIGLFRLLFGFLADPSLGMSNEKRQGIVQSLLDVNILETDEPICSHYELMLSSGEVVRVSSTGNFRWDREASKFYLHDTHVRSSKKASINSAIHFAQVLSEGLLWEEAKHIPRLAELIRMGYLIDFDEDAIYFLLKSENLQLFREDEALLSSKFSSSIQSLPSC